MSRIAGCFLILFLTGCVHLVPDTHRKPASTESIPELPDFEKWQPLINSHQNLNLSDQNLTVSVTFKRSDIWFVIEKNNVSVGAIQIGDSSANYANEVFSFNLARALGVSEYYAPVYFYQLKQNNLKSIILSLEKISPLNNQQMRLKNRVLKWLNQSTQEYTVLFRHLSFSEKSFPEIETQDSQKINTHLIYRGSHTPSAHFLKCQGSQPDSKIQIKINNGLSNEYAASKQLSSLFLMAALTQKKHPFSDTSIQTITNENSDALFVSYYNSQLWSGLNNTQNILSQISRFDKSVIDRVVLMNAVLNKKIGTFYGLSDDQHFLYNLGIQNSPDILDQFKMSLALTTNFIKKNPNCNFK